MTFKPPFPTLLTILLTTLFAAITPAAFAEPNGLGAHDCMPQCGTPIGAEKAGNGEDIPAWTGGIKTRPRAYKRGGAYVEPPKLANDKPLYTITRANAEQYSGLLSAGHQQLLENHSTYHLDVYPTRRTAAYPKRIYTYTKLATVGRRASKRPALTGSDEVTRQSVGFPFPQPLDEASGTNAAAKIMWNHKLRHRGNTMMRRNDVAVVGSKGIGQLTQRVEHAEFFYAHSRKGRSYARNRRHRPVLFKSRLRYPEIDHNAYDSHLWPINASQYPHMIWRRRPGMKAFEIGNAPAYDEPVIDASGLLLADQVDMFNGALDRYDWALLDKREMLIAHNAYRGISPELSYKELLRPGHYHQAIARYEKHRVWVVEARLRPGRKHVFGRRVFYIAEDCWCIAMVDNYDLKGTLHRFQEAHLLNFYDVPMVGAAPELSYDFTTGNYLATALGNAGDPPRFNERLRVRERMLLPGRCGGRTRNLDYRGVTGG